MTGDGGKRADRLLGMLDLISEAQHQGKPVTTATLGSWAQRKYLITNRTAQDYIDALIAFRWITNTNTVLRVTAAGRKALINSEDPAAHPISDPIPEVSTASPEAPPSPPSLEGGGVETDAEAKPNETV